MSSWLKNDCCCLWRLFLSLQTLKKKQTNQQNNDILHLFKAQMCSQSSLGINNTCLGFRAESCFGIKYLVLSTETHLEMTRLKSHGGPLCFYHICSLHPHHHKTNTTVSCRLTSTYSITSKPCDLHGLHLYWHKQTDVLCCLEVPAHSLYTDMRKGNNLAVTFMRTDVILRVHTLTVWGGEEALKIYYMQLFGSVPFSLLN